MSFQLFFVFQLISVSFLLWLMMMMMVSSFIPPQQRRQPPFLTPRDATTFTTNEVISLYSNVTTTTTTTKQQQQQQQQVGLYIHIPYCRQRCHYCNFAIVPVGRHHHRSPNDTDDNDDNETMSDSHTEGFRRMNQNYVSAMLKELRHYQQPLPQQQPKIALQSIYLGGGTPSLLPLHSLTQILNAIQHPGSRLTIRPDCEITLEIDPGTFTRDMLQAWYQMGITRFSIGVQSLNDTILQHLGRTHTTADIDESLRILESIVDHHHHYDDDMDNSQNDDHSNTGPTQRQRLEYSIDLISGVPGLDITTWMDTLHQVTTLWKPHHLSIYDLQMEANTVLGRRYPQHDDDDDDDDRGEEAEIRFSDPTTTSTMNRSSNKYSSDRNNTLLRLPSAQEAAFMYRYASGYLRSKSYEHYEISSYALRKNQTSPGELGSYRSRHNQIYWGYHNVSAWYAIGLGATSFDVHQQIVKRPNAMSDYIQWVNDLTTNTTTNLTDTGHTNNKNVVNDGDDDDDDDAVVEEVTNLTDTGHDVDDDDDDDDDAVVEEVMDIVLKRLRTVDGLSLQYVQEHYGTLYVNAIVRGVQDLLQNPQGPDLIAMSRLNDDDDNNDATRMDQGEDRILRLVDPLGFLYSNTIISNIFYELSKTNDRAQKINAR